MRRTLVLLTLLVTLGLITAPAFAQIDDPQIYVCTGCTTPPGGDPNAINPASVNVGAAGNQAFVAPLLIIVGMVNGGSAPTITGVTNVSGTFTPGGTAVWGMTATAASGGATLMNTNGQDAYVLNGLNPDGGASELFQNWTAADFSLLGITATSFNLFVYELPVALDNTGGSGQNSPITISFSGLTLGSYVLGYSCMTASVSNGQCSPNGNIGETPFTNAGLAVPEPASMALLGTALFGAFGLLRRKLKPAA